MNPLKLEWARTCDGTRCTASIGTSNREGTNETVSRACQSAERGMFCTSNSETEVVGPRQTWCARSHSAMVLVLAALTSLNCATSSGRGEATPLPLVAAPPAPAREAEPVPAPAEDVSVDRSPPGTIPKTPAKALLSLERISAVKLTSRPSLLLATAIVRADYEGDGALWFSTEDTVAAMDGKNPARLAAAYLEEGESDGHTMIAEGASEVDNFELQRGPEAPFSKGIVELGSKGRVGFLGRSGASLRVGLLFGCNAAEIEGIRARGSDLGSTRLETLPESAANTDSPTLTNVRVTTAKWLSKARTRKKNARGMIPFEVSTDRAPAGKRWLAVEVTSQAPSTGFFVPSQAVVLRARDGARYTPDWLTGQFESDLMFDEWYEGMSYVRMDENRDLKVDWIVLDQFGNRGITYQNTNPQKLTFLFAVDAGPERFKLALGRANPVAVLPR